MNSSAVHGERVVIVQVNNGQVQLKTGRISSTQSSHHPFADNQHTTVVWGDQQFRPLLGSPAEAHEREFPVNDIHLLKAQEARSLQDPERAHHWFGSIYQDWVVGNISRALQQLQLA